MCAINLARYLILWIGLCLFYQARADDCFHVTLVANSTSLGVPSSSDYVGTILPSGTAPLPGEKNEHIP